MQDSSRPMSSEISRGVTGLRPPAGGTPIDGARDGARADETAAESPADATGPPPDVATGATVRPATNGSEAGEGQAPASEERSTVGMARLVEGFNRLRRTDDIVRAMLDEGVALVQGRSASLHVMAEGDDELVAVGATGVAIEAVTERFGRIPLSSSVPAAEVVRTGETVVVTSEHDRRSRYPDLDIARIEYDTTFIVLPLKDALGRPFGSMGVGFDADHTIDAADRDLLRDVAAHCALALDRARQADAAERAQDHLGFLDALGATLSSSLELDTALAQLTEMTVPRIADWCIVRLLVTPGSPRPRVGATHVDPAQIGHLRRLVERIPRDLGSVPELGDALAAGRPLIRTSRAAAMLRPLFDDPDDREAMDAVGVDSVAVFPLHARNRLLGAVAFGNRPGRPLHRTDVELAKAVASRAGVIVDNARLFNDQAQVARALQNSLLPSSLPDIPGIELGARYRAAGQGLDVGGDFYDAFQADANWWMFAVGDVRGHGVEAAATTGLVRHTIRASAMSGVMPSAVLGRLNDMLLRSDAEREEVGDDHLPVSPRFCTVLAGAVQASERGVDIIVCSGGHPLPLVRRGTGEVVPVGVPGTLLGVTPTDNVSLSDTVVHLDPGESLICYTDGLSDRRSGRRVFGEEGIVKAVCQGKGLTAAELARHIEAEALVFVDDEPADDMAVLTLRAAPRT